MRLLLPSLLLAAHFGAAAQSLPAPSRVIYKCEVAGKIAYTDEPCLGAQRLDIEPSRGLNKYSGRAKTGADVERENFRDQLSDAIRPISGLDRRQYATQTRRVNLAGAVQQECKTLDQAIPRFEASEAASSREARPLIQRDLLTLRKRFKDLRC